MQTKNRLESIDTIRGITVISMILYHFCWDLKFIKGFNMPWYGTSGTYMWQQSICWSFILISGFCLHFARQPIRNGLIVSLCGFIVTAVTLIVLPEDPVYIGVLTLLGSSMLILGLVIFLLKKLGIIDNANHTKENKHLFDPLWGFFISAILFAITKKINVGLLNFGVFKLALPDALYGRGLNDGMSNLHLTYLGFMQEGFISSDYFSIMPWFFLFLTGYFLYGILEKRFSKSYFQIKIQPFSWIGKHSLLIYMLHQPILYGITMLL
ncbi:DUF1624 domain-containing protein [Butyrivibrio sp. WCD2001]|uniref:DUF1624 domain-containing protein n=1 Tax=Butyrivibrio sp. WCD2001 TaxID=1280681 RepID=UPI00047B8D26|nr:heparan-alpha-glucosaminide N-acetyltransferase [Butyrivibrio sp. WCD2001]